MLRASHDRRLELAVQASVRLAPAPLVEFSAPAPNLCNTRQQWSQEFHLSLSTISRPPWLSRQRFSTQKYIATTFTLEFLESVGDIAFPHLEVRNSVWTRSMTQKGLRGQQRVVNCTQIIHLLANNHAKSSPALEDWKRAEWESYCFSSIATENVSECQISTTRSVRCTVFRLCARRTNSHRVGRTDSTLVITIAPSKLTPAPVLVDSDLVVELTMVSRQIDTLLLAAA